MSPDRNDDIVFLDRYPRFIQDCETIDQHGFLYRVGWGYYLADDEQRVIVQFEVSLEYTVAPAPPVQIETNYDDLPF